MEPLLERVVDDADDGARADVVVARLLDEPRTRTQERLAAGEVLIEGRPAAKSRRLRAGERLVVQADEPVAPEPTPPPLPVRWADEHLAVVAKPAGLTVHAGAGTRGGTMVEALLAQGIPLHGGEDADRPGIVHRLDRGTSGLLVVATSPQAYAGLVAAFKVHAVDRRYWCLVEGVPDPSHATVDAPIGRSATQRQRFTVTPSGRRAVSHYDVLAEAPAVAEVAVRLETGRTHQVRVHLAAVGHPVCGDRLYGGSAPLAAQLGLERPALHARHLGFDHPVTGERIDLDEPLPEDLVAARRAAFGPAPPADGALAR